MSEAKAISCCGDCIYYNYKRHRCMRGCNDEGEATDSFYRDCPLPPATITKHKEHGKSVRIAEQGR